MKTNEKNQDKVPQTNTKAQDNTKRPQNKDDLDSREGEEQDNKGDDITHNKKEHKSEGKDKK